MTGDTWTFNGKQRTAIVVIAELVAEGTLSVDFGGRNILELTVNKLTPDTSGKAEAAVQMESGDSLVFGVHGEGYMGYRFTVIDATPSPSTTRESERQKDLMRVIGNLPYQRGKAIEHLLRYDSRLPVSWDLNRAIWYITSELLERQQVVVNGGEFHSTLDAIAASIIFCLGRSDASNLFNKFDGDVESLSAAKQYEMMRLHFWATTRWIHRMEQVGKAHDTVIQANTQREWVKTVDDTSGEFKLDWTDTQPANDEIGYAHVIAKTPFGRILITWKSHKQYDSPTIDEAPWYSDADSTFLMGNDVEDTKRLAEREFMKRVGLSCNVMGIKLKI